MLQMLLLSAPNKFMLEGKFLQPMNSKPMHSREETLSHAELLSPLLLRAPNWSQFLPSAERSWCYRDRDKGKEEVGKGDCCLNPHTWRKEWLDWRKMTTYEPYIRCFLRTQKNEGTGEKCEIGSVELLRPQFGKDCRITPDDRHIARRLNWGGTDRPCSMCSGGARKKAHDEMRQQRPCWSGVSGRQAHPFLTTSLDSNLWPSLLSRYNEDACFTVAITGARTEWYTISILVGPFRLTSLRTLAGLQRKGNFPVIAELLMDHQKQAELGYQQGICLKEKCRRDWKSLCDQRGTFGGCA